MAVSCIIVLLLLTWLISHQYFSLRTNQPPATSQQYFYLRTNQHQPSATSQTDRLLVLFVPFQCCLCNQYRSRVFTSINREKRKNAKSSQAKSYGTKIELGWTARTWDRIRLTAAGQMNGGRFKIEVRARRTFLASTSQTDATAGCLVDHMLSCRCTIPAQFLRARDAMLKQAGGCDYINLMRNYLEIFRP
jgi:hypothetical protein